MRSGEEQTKLDKTEGGWEGIRGIVVGTAQDKG